MPLIVVKDGDSLMGRNWLEHIHINWAVIHSLRLDRDVEHPLQKHASLFRDEAGLLKATTAQLFLPPETRPKFFKPRRLSYALKEGGTRVPHRWVQSISINHMAQIHDC